MEIEGYPNYILNKDGAIYSKVSKRNLKPSNVGIICPHYYWCYSLSKDGTTKTFTMDTIIKKSLFKDEEQENKKLWFKDDNNQNYNLDNLILLDINTRMDKIRKINDLHRKNKF